MVSYDKLCKLMIDMKIKKATQRVGWNRYDYNCQSC